MSRKQCPDNDCKGHLWLRYNDYSEWYWCDTCEQWLPVTKAPDNYRPSILNRMYRWWKLLRELGPRGI